MPAAASISSQLPLFGQSSTNDLYCAIPNYIVQSSPSIGSPSRVPAYYSNYSSPVRQLPSMHQSAGGILCDRGCQIRREPVLDLRTVLEMDG